MNEAMRERIVESAYFFVENKSTVRATAAIMGCSKSTTYLDMKYRIWKIDSVLAKKVQLVLSKNKDERSIRGGQVTKQKFKSQKME